ncbi:hypothetical protein X975_20569, partial [Stegodyphus mimosarum]
MKFEATRQATRRGRCSVRAVQVYEPADQLMAGLDDLSRQVNALRCVYLQQLALSAVCTDNNSASNLHSTAGDHAVTIT